MQRKFQHTFTKSKMNKDLDARLLGADEYRDGINIAVSRAEADDVGALENILGNEILSSLGVNNIPVTNLSALPTSRTNTSSIQNLMSRIIGWNINENTNKIYLFITNYQDNSDNQLDNFCAIQSVQRIVLVDTVTSNTSTIVEGRFLNFSINSPILDSVMLEDILFWTDNRNQPRCINVNTAEANTDYYFSEDHISQAKYYPSKPIELSQTTTVQGTLTTATGPKTAGDLYYNSVYAPLMVKLSDLTEAQKSLLTNSTGLRAYIISSAGSRKNDVINFTVADAYQTPEGGSYTFPAPWYKCWLIHADRDLSNFAANVTTPYGTESPITIGFIEETSKDVSSPWLKESQVKLQLGQVNANNNAYYTNTTLTGSYIDNVATSIYQEGRRANPIVGLEAYNLQGKFPTNIGTAQNAYCRITHPKLDPNIYYVIINTSPVAGNTVGRYFGTAIMSSLENGGTMTNVADMSALLSTGDIVSVHWPNKNYDANFAGDPIYLEDKFVRFAYRFRYDDGQHSLISPFTQEVFIPKQGGYFQKEIGKIKSKGNDQNNYIDQLNRSGQTTINDEIMENEITQIKLKIPCQFPLNKIVDQLKVNEIDILYKESMSSNIMLVESIDVNDASVADNTTNYLEYSYDSKEPIRTLRSAETTRVYDQIPVRAKTLASSGNRIILGNFYDRHSSPGRLNYYVGASSKFQPAELPVNPIGSTTSDDLKPALFNKNSFVAYKNHSLKQNRTYQVGLILQDKYGRSSDVIISNVEDESFLLDGPGTTYSLNPIRFGGSTIFHGYKDSTMNPLTAFSQIAGSPNTRSGIIDWPGDSLKMLFTRAIPYDLPLIKGYPGLFDDPIITTPSQNAGSNNAFYIPIVSGGINDNITTGMKVTYTLKSTGVSYDFRVLRVLNGGPPPPAGSGQNLITVTRENANSPTGTYGVQSAELPSYNAADIGTPVTFSFSDKVLGFDSYKVVVKQLEQDYYNVYMPSLLDGTPVVKPFDLNCTFVKNSTTATVDPIGTIEYRTFPLIEGMKVVAGTNTYFIQNIINYTEFELTTKALANYSATPAPLKDMGFGFFQPTQADITAGSIVTNISLVNAATGGGTGSGGKVSAIVDTSGVGATKKLIITMTSAGVNYAIGDKLTIPAKTVSGGSSAYPQIEFIITTGNLETASTNFSTQSSTGVLNTTTLLTDNANKIPPALEEASPVQVNYSTSEVDLIPRTAKQTNWTATANSPFYTTNDHTMPIFPLKTKLKVQTIGNFESLFKRGSYNGLYAADTDPPTAIIKNGFNMGQDSQIAKPSSEVEQVPAIYETSPTESNLEIFYETSTAGSIKELNNFIRSTLNYPAYISSYPGDSALQRIVLNESTAFDAGTGFENIATIQLRDQKGNLLNYHGGSQNIRNITISEPQYASGTTLGGTDSITLIKVNATDANMRFLIRVTSDFPGYNSQYFNINNIYFNINLEYKVDLGVATDIYNNYSIPVRLFIDNSAPVQGSDFIDDNTTVYYLKNDKPYIDPTAYLANGTTTAEWDNNNGGSTTLNSATNGGNASNTAQRANTNELVYEMLLTYSGGTSVNANSVEQSGLYLSDSGQLPGQILLATTGNSIIIDENINVKINAIDNNGFGLKTNISDFIIRFLP